MNPIKGASDKEQKPESVQPQKPQALTKGGPLRQVQVAEPGKPRVSKKSVDVNFQPLGKRSMHASEDAWSQVDQCVEAIGMDLEEWRSEGTQDERAAALLEVIEATLAEDGLESEFATVMLEMLSALACAIEITEDGDAQLQELNLSRVAALACDAVHDFGDKMDAAQTGLMLQAASNIYTNRSSDASVCERGAVLLNHIADRCELAEGSNQRSVLLNMLEKPPSRLKKDPDFLKAHARAIGTACAALDGLTEAEAKSLLNGIKAILSRTTDPGVREACLEALQNLESFPELSGALLADVQKLATKLEKLLA